MQCLESKVNNEVDCSWIYFEDWDAPNAGETWLSLGDHEPQAGATMC